MDESAEEECAEQFNLVYPDYFELEYNRLVAQPYSKAPVIDSAALHGYWLSYDVEKRNAPLPAVLFHFDFENHTESLYYLWIIEGQDTAAIYHQKRTFKTYSDSLFAYVKFNTGTEWKYRRITDRATETKGDGFGYAIKVELDTIDPLNFLISVNNVCSNIVVVDYDDGMDETGGMVILTHDLIKAKKPIERN